MADHTGGAASILGSMQASISISVRNYLSSQYLWTAQHNSELCRAREDEVMGKRPIDIQHRSYAVTAILTSVAFIEALVNEIFEDAADEQHVSERTAPIEQHKAKLASFWRSVDDGRYQILGKYQMVLLLCGADKFVQGSQPYQDTEVLVRLRNALAHFKPEWYGTDSPDNKLRLKLAERIKQSGLLGANDGSDWITVKALGAPGAEWAVKTAKTFAGDWCERLGIPKVFETDLANWDKELGAEG